MSDILFLAVVLGF